MQARPPPTRILQATGANGFIEDHEQALEILGQLRTAAEAPAALDALQRAAFFLEPHMSEEEAADGVFHWLLALEPGLAAEVDRLVEEHAEIREAMSAALDAPDDEVVALAQAFANLLEAHEAAERAALDRAVQ